LGKIKDELGSKIIRKENRYILKGMNEDELKKIVKEAEESVPVQSGSI
jgi:hypothetical protein